MNIKLKKYIDIILILIFSTALYKTHAADASKDFQPLIGFKAYLSLETWSEKNRYNASHFLLVPMYYIYQNNNTSLIKKIDQNMNNFLEKEAKNLKFNITSERLPIWQYLYFVSEYNNLSSRKNMKLNNFLIESVEKNWNSPSWQWGKINAFPTLKEKLEWKLNATENEGYKRALVDEELFFLGVAANLSLSSPKNKILKEINNISLQLFEKKSSFNDEGWLYDVGAFDNYPDYAYAGYTNIKDISSPKPEKNIAIDSSHFFRIPKILLSLQKAYKEDSPEYIVYQKYRIGLENQFFNKVLVIKNNNIYLTNYMDGKNGIFRWEYPTLGKGRGYQPFGLTPSFGMGWWSFLPNTKIKTTYKDYYKQITKNLNIIECNTAMENIIKNKEIENPLLFQNCMYSYNAFLASQLNKF